jgi:hypothetical protein
MNKKPEAKQYRTAWFFVFGCALIIMLLLSILAATRLELEISASINESAVNTLHSMERNKDAMKDIRKESEALKDILK